MFSSIFVVYSVYIYFILFLRYTVNLTHCKLNFMQNSCNERLCARGGVGWQRLPHLGLSPHSRPLPLTLLGWHQVPERSVSRDFRLHFFPLSHESNPPTVIWIYHAVSNNRLITSITSCGRIVHYSLRVFFINDAVKSISIFKDFFIWKSPRFLKMSLKLFCNNLAVFSRKYYMSVLLYCTDSILFNKHTAHYRITCQKSFEPIIG